MEKLIELRHQLQLRYKQPGSLPAVMQAKAFNPEELFLQKVIRIVEANLADEDFGMHELCRAVNMSRSHLFRKLKAITGKSTTVFIRTLRLKKAKELLMTTDLNVSEVAYNVGFNNPKYFSRVFVEEFGVAPSEVRKG
ncbi:MAG: AraC family transcriptional regulator [Saprospiraceae bacterium]